MAVAIAPVDLAERTRTGAVQSVVAIGDGDGGARDTAESLAAALGARSRRSPTRTPTCWWSTRAPRPSRPRRHQRLRRTPRRDRDEPGARAAARPRVDVRASGRHRVGEACRGVRCSGGRRSQRELRARPALRVSGRARAPAPRPARRPRGGRSDRSTARPPGACERVHCREASCGGTVSWRS